ncbi:MAG: MotA/TolQ/ExbB proton channel family protein, partial [Betaproteobacteria bacterium]|nr:MotA/TolQ/ExbB proton channel family protein [Betaproteobacteria bacterium]
MSFINRFVSLLTAAFMIMAPLSVAVVAATPSEAVAQAPAAAGAGDVTKVTVDNPYGFEAVWNEGDFVSKGTLVILLLMSMGSWYILIMKLFEQARVMKQSREAGESFWSAGSVPQGINTLKEE